MKIGLPLVLPIITLIIIFDQFRQSLSEITSCKQCDPSTPAEYDNCLQEDLVQATDCPPEAHGKPWVACITTIKTIDGSFLHISRECSSVAWNQSTSTGFLERYSLGVKYRIHYCQTDGCNNVTVNTTTGSKDRNCLSCFGVESTDPKKENNCNQKLGFNSAGPVTVPCRYRPCFYEETKDSKTGRLLAVKRGCDADKNSTDNLQSSYGCYNKTDGAKRCYCYNDKCNRNTPKGIKCQQCLYSESGCSEGKTKEKTCSVSVHHFGATGFSCKETKVTDVKGTIKGYDRGCSAYNEAGCDERYCYCNTNGCVKRTHNSDSSRIRANVSYMLFFGAVTIFFASLF